MTLDDEQRSGRPSTSRTDEQHAEMKAMIKKKDYISEFTLSVGFVYGSKFSIVEVDLNYHEVCLIWVHDMWRRNTRRPVYGNWKVSSRDRVKM